jgi:hypothetical protein
MQHMPTNILDQSGLRVARCDFDGDATHPDAQDNAKQICQAMNSRVDLVAALEKVLVWMTNVNADDPGNVSLAVIRALKKAGYDEEALDAAWMAMLKGAAHR